MFWATQGSSPLLAKSFSSEWMEWINYINHLLKLSIKVSKLFLMRGNHSTKISVMLQMKGYSWAINHISYFSKEISGQQSHSIPIENGSFSLPHRKRNINEKNWILNGSLHTHQIGCDSFAFAYMQMINSFVNCQMRCGVEGIAAFVSSLSNDNIIILES